uniref:Capsid protein n=1 Tax=Parvoviridae sp. TaxID=1940570 RepID=A0A7D3QM90_9VIRU|nr:MAG: capsid protein [Parvoviridae sp.]
MTGLLQRFETWYETAASTWRNTQAGAPPPKPNQQRQHHDSPPKPNPVPGPSTRPDDYKRGLVLPGYKYLGPFNSLNKGPPVNEADAAAERHDHRYDAILKAGGNPYLTYNWADELFHKELATDTSWGGNLGRAVFRAKKRLLEPLGLTDNLPPPPKKAKQDPVPETPPDTPPDNSPGSSESLDISDMSGGGGQGLGGSQSGGDGVGNASGNWHCHTQWMDNTVITSSTRTWCLPSYNNNLYKQISSSTDVNNAYFGYSTPWGYFDFNRFHCHWSPRDWQRLINNHYGFRPKSMRVKIFNIQVKEVATVNSEKQITNNLTSTVQIFADSDYSLPYVGSSATEGSLPPFPADVFLIPQYGYCSLHGWSSSQTTGTARTAFYCLEYFPSQMLRTGNTYEFSFDFPHVPFHTGYALNQSLDRLANPLLDQYLWHFQSTDGGGKAKFAKAVANNWAEKYQNWMPGPFWKTQGWIPDNNARSQNSWGVCNKSEVNLTLSAVRPGPNGMCNADPQVTNRFALDNSMIFVNQPVAPGESGLREMHEVRIGNEDETLPVNYRANWSGPITARNQQQQGTDPTRVTNTEKGVHPGNVWMDRDVYLQGPIWAKIPDTDAVFHPTPNMGGFGLHNPPPMILIRNTAVPADPPAAYRDGPLNAFITQYSTGQVTVEMTWEVLKEKSKRWNPEIQFTNNWGDTRLVDFAPDSSGKYAYNRLIGTRFLTKHL